MCCRGTSLLCLLSRLKTKQKQCVGLDQQATEASPGIRRVWLNYSYHLCTLNRFHGSTNAAPWACLEHLHIKPIAERRLFSRHGQMQHISGCHLKVSFFSGITTLFFVNLLHGCKIWRLWFASGADDPAVVHIKDIIRDLCAPPCIMLHGKQGDGSLITSWRNTD